MAASRNLIVVVALVIVVVVSTRSMTSTPAVLYVSDVSARTDGVDRVRPFIAA